MIATDTTNNLKSASEFATAVIGLGYIGLPLLLRIAEVKLQVIGIDVDPEKIVRLEKSDSYISHISSERIKAAQKFASYSNDYESLINVNVIVICVPTPLDKNKAPDLSFVSKTVEDILPFLREGQMISLESTTYPGTTEEILVPLIESTGLKVGKDIFLVYSPEREDPGNQDFNTQKIPKIVSGHSDRCLEFGKVFYSKICDDIVPVSSTKVAEITKLFENIHRAVNIGLVNEMKILTDSMGINIYEVINAAKTKPFGFAAYYPGPGLGGHCIPIDPFYLTWKAKEYGVNTRFIELAGEINSSMPNYVIEKIIQGLNRREKSLKGSKILILGIAYKKNVDDTRESPGIFILDKLIKHGAIVDYCDPHVPVFPEKRDYEYDMKSVELSSDSITDYDCVVITTDHDAFDYDLIARSANLIVDSRGVYKIPDAHIINA